MGTVKFASWYSRKVEAALVSQPDSTTTSGVTQRIQAPPHMRDGHFAQQIRPARKCTLTQALCVILKTAVIRTWNCPH